MKVRWKRKIERKKERESVYVSNSEESKESGGIKKDLQKKKKKVKEAKR